MQTVERHLRELQAKWGGGAGGGGAENDSRSSVSPAKRAHRSRVEERPPPGEPRNWESRIRSWSRARTERVRFRRRSRSSSIRQWCWWTARGACLSREQGATDVTLARLDRAIDIALETPAMQSTTPRWHGNRLCPIVLTRRSPEGSWRTPRLEIRARSRQSGDPLRRSRRQFARRQGVRKARHSHHVTRQCNEEPCRRRQSPGRAPTV